MQMQSAELEVIINVFLFYSQAVSKMQIVIL